LRTGVRVQAGYGVQGSTANQRTKFNRSQSAKATSFFASTGRCRIPSRPAQRQSPAVRNTAPTRSRVDLKVLNLGFGV
jgi:hypothetical protein